MARKPTLVQLDDDLIRRLDAHASEWFHGNRSRLIVDACELLLAQHAAYQQRERSAAAVPRSGPSAPGPRHTSDRAPARPGEPSTAPITSALMDL